MPALRAITVGGGVHLGVTEPSLSSCRGGRIRDECPGDSSLQR